MFSCSLPVNGSLGEGMSMTVQERKKAAEVWKGRYLAPACLVSGLSTRIIYRECYTFIVMISLNKVFAAHDMFLLISCLVNNI